MKSLLIVGGVVSVLIAARFAVIWLCDAKQPANTDDAWDAECQRIAAELDGAGPRSTPWRIR